ncbi:aspartate/glutamate racemase family protein [Liquorilactobacillus uvarum]|uniref:aspartate/glutamate racemase family protein n=2 Tax=Liquorilactobacillus uvarum TaxID=303240 RepID=UPI00288A2A42|nr:amino acid racemase [Liquorilactobacillus uvarum]
MTKLGIIGGLGPEATSDYYFSIIKQYQQKVGSNKRLPELTIESIDMYHMFSLLDQKKYDQVADYVAQAANNLQSAGANFGVMCGNTPHIVFNEIQNRTTLPLLSMVQTSLDKAKEKGLKNLGLLGTKFTMQNDFFKEPFEKSGIHVWFPSLTEQSIIHQKIVDELENGIVKQETKNILLKIITNMIDKYNLDGIVLGCTELPLILSQKELFVYVLDISQIHIEAIVKKL